MTCEDGGVENLPGDRPGLPRRVGESLTRLARVTGELSRADTVDAVAKIVTYHMADAVGATIAALALREGDHARLIGLRGSAPAWHSAGTPSHWPRAAPPPTSSPPAPDGARRWRRDERGVPRPAQLDRGERTIVALPLRVTGAPSAPSPCPSPGPSCPTPPSSTSSRSWPTRARRPSSASSRPRGAEADRTPGLPRRGLDRAGEQPRPRGDDRPGDPPRRADLRRLVRRRRRARRPVHRLAVAHVDPEKVQLAIELQERWPPDPSSPSGAWAVARSGRPELLHEITDEMLVAGALTRSSSGWRASWGCVAPCSCRSSFVVRSSACSPGSRPTTNGSTTRTTCASPSTWPAGRPRPSTTPSCTARPGPRRSSCRRRAPRGRLRPRPLGRRLRVPAVRAGRDRGRLLRRVPARRRPLRRLPRRRHGPRGGRGGRHGPDAGGDARLRLGRPRPRGGPRQARPDGRALRHRPARHAPLRPRRRYRGHAAGRQRRAPATVDPAERRDGRAAPFADGAPLA